MLEIGSNASKLIKAIFILSKNTQDGKDEGASTFDDVNANALAGMFLQDSSSQLDLPEVHYNLLQNASKIMVLTRDAPKLAPELLIETFSRCCSLMSDEYSSSYNDMQLKNTIHQVLIALEPWVQSIKLEELTKGGTPSLQPHST